MAIDIIVLKDQGIIKLAYSPGEITQEELEEHRALVAEAITESGIRNVLVDLSGLTQLPSIVTIIEHNAALSTQSTLRTAKFAVLCRSLGENEQFLETTGLNRGVQIRCFRSMESGLSWLGD